MGVLTPGQLPVFTSQNGQYPYPGTSTINEWIQQNHHNIDKLVQARVSLDQPQEYTPVAYIADPSVWVELAKQISGYNDIDWIVVQLTGEGIQAHFEYFVDAGAGFIDSFLNTINPFDEFWSIPDIGPVFGNEDAYGYGQVAGSIAGVVANLAISMLPGVGLINCGTKVAKGAFIAWEVVSAVGDVATAVKHYNEGNFGWGDVLSIAGTGFSLKGIGSIQCFTVDMHLTEDMVDRQFVIPPAPLAKTDPDEQINDAWIALGVGMLFTTSLQFRRRRQRRISNMSDAPLISTDDSLERESPTERPDAAALDEAFCGVLQLESKPAARDSQPNTCQTHAVSQELASHAAEVTSSRVRVPRLCEPCLPSPRSSRFFELRRWLFLLVGLLFSGFCFQQSGLLQSSVLSLPSAVATMSETDPTRVPPAASGTTAFDSPSYKTKSVAAFQPGDEILAYNTSTKKLEQRKVKNAFRKTADHLRLLTLRDESGREQTIKTTNEHPFYEPASERYLSARWLQAGDEVQAATGELLQVVSSVYEPHPEGVVVYNVEVEGEHNYFVLARGARAPPVLAHNRCGPGNWIDDNYGTPMSRTYQGQITGKYGKQYKVGDIKFDGYKYGDLIEAKGRGYQKLLSGSKGGEVAQRISTNLIDQASRQSKAAAAVGKNVRWYVEEKKVAEMLKGLFKDAGLDNIRVINRRQTAFPN